MNEVVLKKLLTEIEDVKQNNIDTLNEIKKVEFTLRKILAEVSPKKPTFFEKVKASFLKR